MKILIILEDNNGKIHRMGLESIVAAQTMASNLNGSIIGVVIGKNADALADEAASYKLDEVIKIKEPLLDNYSADGYAEAVKQVIEQESPSYVLFGHSYQVRDLSLIHISEPTRPY